MNDIFDVVGEYKQVFEMLTDPEVDEQTVLDTLEGLMGEIEVKAEGLVSIIDRLEMEQDACKKHEDMWHQRRMVRENNIKRIKQMIVKVMDELGVNDIQAGDVKLHVQNAGGVLPLIVDENATVPERFTKLTIENDNELIRKALNDGEELPFARFGNRSRTLRIK